MSSAQSWTGAAEWRERPWLSSPAIARRRSARLRRRLAAPLFAGDGGGALRPPPLCPARPTAPGEPRGAAARIRHRSYDGSRWRTGCVDLVWRRLDPWPDSVPGLTRLRRGFIIAPLFNGNIRLMLDLAKRARLPWDAFLGAELAQAYKPMPEAYVRTVETLMPEQVCLVAAHKWRPGRRAIMRFEDPVHPAPDEAWDRPDDRSFARSGLRRRG